MVSVGRIGPPSGPQSGKRRIDGTGFAVSSQPSNSVAGPAAAAAAAGLDGLLALQEGEHDTVRDRQARRHGHALLEALARLQHDLLCDGAADLTALAGLVDDMPLAATPALQAALAGIALRAKVELARRGL